MKFYLGSLEGLPRYARTQTDAKPLEGVEVVDLKTDQASLVERFNGLIDEGVAIGRALGPIGGNGADLVVEGEKLGTDAEATSTEEATPAKPKRKQPAETYPERCWDQIMVEEFIHAVRSDESYRLDVLERMIDSRREEIARGVGPA